MQTKITPKDFFLYVAATVSLYSAVVALINLGFASINYAFPDQLAYSYYSSQLSWPMSMVVVLVPVFYVLEWMIGRDVRQYPEKAGLWIRRWRAYLTLFLTGATIIGDVIALINVYLSGEITSRFIWKILIVLAVAAVVFVYYLIERQDAQGASIWKTLLAWLGIILVLAAIVGGFVIVGSPAKQRQIRFDNQRVSDLSSIQYQILNYWQTKNELPQSLTDLKDSFSYFNLPSDPETKQPYSYNKIASTTFSICANFSRKMEDTTGRGAYKGISMPSSAYDIGIGYPNGDEKWAHEAGQKCFERTIDTTKYAPGKPRY